MDCDFAADASFGPRVAPCRRQFDFTLSFEHWILTLIPELFFIFGGLVRWFWIYRSPKVLKAQPCGLARAKLVAAILLLALKTASLVAWATTRDAATLLAILSAAAALVSVVILIPLSQYEHSRAVRPSTLICLYLLATAVLETAQVRTLWLLQPFSLVLATLTTASLALRVLLLAIEAQNKQFYLASANEKASPESTSGILNRSVYWWINSLFFQGFRSDLGVQNLYDLDQHLTAEPLTADLQRRWNSDETRHSHKHALLRHTFASAKWAIIKAVVARAILIPFKYAQPFLFNDLIQRVSQPDAKNQEGARYGLLGAVLLLYSLLAATTAIYKRQTIQMMTIMRGGLVGIIYAQTLQNKTPSSSGANALTLMSTDVDRIVVGVQNTHEMWAAGIEIAIALSLLVVRVGYPSVAALVVAAACIAGSSYIAPHLREKQSLWVQAVQQRINFTASILKVMRTVKILGIEATVTEKTDRLRKLELDASKPFRLLIVGVNVFTAAATSMAPAATIILYTTTRMSLSTEIPRPDTIFTSLSLISLLTSSVSELSFALTEFASGVGSFDRIQSYLLLATQQDETLCQPFALASESTTKLKVVPEPGPKLVDARGASFRYTSQGTCQLNDLVFTASRSEFVAITGPLSCGKSTLLKAVLGEISRVKGQLSVQTASLAYCQQMPYIFNGTIQNNIVGNAHVDTVWLNKVLFSCDLLLDIDSLQDGLETVVGTSGLQLSGGQKQRVALARAVYAKPQLLLLDDIFSAVDTITASRIFQRLFGSAGVFRQLGSGVMMVTVAADQLHYADKVIVLSDSGDIDVQGNYSEIAKTCSFVQQLALTKDQSKITEQEPTSDSAKESARPKATNVSATPAAAKGRGSGDLSLYGYYIDSIGRLSFLCILGYVAVYAASLVLPQLLLSWWSSSVPDKGVAYLVTYTVVSVASVVAVGLYIGYFFVWAVPKSAIRLHRLLLDVVMQMPWVQLLHIKTGDLITRFSQDMSLVDMQLPVAFGITLQMFLTCVAQGVVIAIGSGYMSIVIPFCIAALYAIQLFYLRTSRQIRLLYLETQAPLYDHFLQTIDGGATIRAFKWQERFVRANQELLDQSQKPFYALHSVQQWLQVVLDLLVAALATLLTALVLIVKKESTAGSVGVALVNLLSFNTSLTMLITNWMQLETSLGAISRTKEFVTNPDHQPAQAVEDEAHEKEILAETFEFRNVSASYGNKEELILKNISLSLKGGQKVGICGRTGSGKSTLLSCFFSLVNIVSGSVYIDGVDIKAIPKDKLHAAIITIPQHAFLMAGTVRENLALGSPCPATDEAIVSVLKQLQVWDRIHEHGGLDASISSVPLTESQRQLVCIGRALLQPGRIVILDEPTSGFDEDTGQMAQALIEKVFRDRLVLSVAHKIDTIIDSDLVVVMDRGQVAEMGSPAELLQQKGRFWELRQ